MLMIKDGKLKWKNQFYEIQNDAFEAIKALKQGKWVARFEFGESMMPLLKNGEYAVLEPYKEGIVEQGDAVFCQVNGYIMTHMVLMISKIQDKPMYLIGGPDLSIYGWTDTVFAKAHSTNIIEKREVYGEE